MSRTANLDLPLVQASQSQKHITVNEALGLLDGVCQMTLESIVETQEPAIAEDGQVWSVPSGATGNWAAEAGKLAIFSNGGWVFTVPKAGWRGWAKDTGESVLYDGVDWVPAAVSVSRNGAATVLEVIEIDVDLQPGPVVVTVPVIPAVSVVFGVTGRVVQQITGTLSTWRLGVAGSPDAYGSGLGVALGSWAMGVSGQPQAYYTDSGLQLEAEGGEFLSGQVRLAVHVLRLKLPRI